MLDALREGRFYGSDRPARSTRVELDDDASTVRCSPVAERHARSPAAARGARANAGRLGYPHGARDPRPRRRTALITAARLERPWAAGRTAALEVADAAGPGWTNPLWI